MQPNDTGRGAGSRGPNRDDAYLLDRAAQGLFPSPPNFDIVAQLRPGT